MDLQQLVKDRIAALGLPKREIAARAGVNPTYISELISGKKRSIQKKFVSRLAFALQVDPLAIVESMGQEGESELSPQDLVAAAREELVGLIIEPFLFSIEDRMEGEAPFLPDEAAIPFVTEFPQDFIETQEQGTACPVGLLRWESAFRGALGLYAVERGAITQSRGVWENEIYLAAPGLPIRIDDPFLAVCSFGYRNIAPRLYRLKAREESFLHVSYWFGPREETLPIAAVWRAHRIVATVDGAAIWA